MWSKCRLCNKLRCLFTLDKDKGKKTNIIPKVKEYLDMLPLQCGMSLFTLSNEFHLKEKVFLKQSVTCRETMENIYYFEIKPPLSFPVVCVYCGTSEDISTADTTLNDRRKTRPQCNSCCSDRKKDCIWEKNYTRMESISTVLSQAGLCVGDIMDKSTTQEVDTGNNKVSEKMKYMDEDELSEENDEDDSEMYEVENILRRKKAKGGMHLLIKWKGTDNMGTGGINEGKY